MTIKIVVPISGGKDSQACLKLALQEYDKSEVMGLFCDTQWEHPLTYEHIEKMRGLYGVKIETICAGDVPSQVLKRKRFPSGDARFCTSELKIKPSKMFYKALAQEQGGFQVWYGMRSDESKERKKRYRGKTSTETYFPHDIFKNSYPKYLAKMGVLFRLPVVDWGSKEIFKLLNGEENPLYSMGSQRVGCFPCLAAGDPTKYHAFNLDDVGAERKEIVLRLEQQTGKSVWTSIAGSMKNNPNQNDAFHGCGICSI